MGTPGNVFLMGIISLWKQFIYYLLLLTWLCFENVDDICDSMFSFSVFRFTNGYSRRKSLEDILGKGQLILHLIDHPVIIANLQSLSWLEIKLSDLINRMWMTNYPKPNPKLCLDFMTKWMMLNVYAKVLFIYDLVWKPDKYRDLELLSVTFHLKIGSYTEFA